MGFEVGDRVVICKVAYNSCTEDGYPFLEPGNEGTIRLRFSADDYGDGTLYDVVMDNDPKSERVWALYEHELEKVDK